jgi:hypothetical protein
MSRARVCACGGARSAAARSCRSCWRAATAQAVTDPQERFWLHVDRRRPDECWPWTAARSRTGYGKWYPVDREVAAHRFAYEQAIGPIPDSLDIDHVCHSSDAICPGGWTCPHRLCVNPAHLEAVTHRENILRGRNHIADQMRKTHCIRGHPLPEKRDKRGQRVCNRCWVARYHERKVAAA